MFPTVTVIISCPSKTIYLRKLHFLEGYTNPEIPLSPDGGEGWGEGEFCWLLAKIAKIIMPFSGL
jgi:hypothetical protein